MIDIQEIKQELIKHAKEFPNEEVCGLISINLDNATLDVHRCSNVADDKTNSFIINPSEWVAHTHDVTYSSGKIMGFYHSHIGEDPNPSEYDRIFAGKSDIASFLVFGDSVTAIKPFAKAPMLGRKFIYGAADCYTLVQDYYGDIGIPIPDYLYKPGDEPRMTRLGAEESGFKSMPTTAKIRKHDLLLLRYMKAEGDHLAIYVNSDTILHHLPTQISKHDPLSRWSNRVIEIWRHESLV